MRKLFLYIICIFLVQITTAQSYTPKAEVLNVEYNYIESFFGMANTALYPDLSKWSSKIEVKNAKLVSGNSSQTGMTANFWVEFSTPSVQATVKIIWLYTGVSVDQRIWTVNVKAKPTPPAPTLYLNGSSEIKEGSSSTYKADYSSHSSSTNYTWSTTNGNVSIISGQGTSSVTIQPKVPEGTETLKVTAGGLSATKTIKITPLCGITNVTNQTITTNKDFSNCAIVVSGVNIKNNAVVNFTAKDSIVIKPNFVAEKGANVTFKVTGVEPRSAEAIEYLLFMEPEISRVSTNLDDTQIHNGNPELSSIRIYSTMGALIQSSTSDIDIYSLGLDNGIYIVEKTDTQGNIYRGKIALRR